ncbi:MAG: hypothetical protein NAG76_13350 [Candidatus Pristimantibacillus lignocellulolyticus]|uniref:Sporulation membrane protein YtrI C-terminal domain-containing protein n=1 Tax=Candidatus Pristimantibacillus lignocellulolyticus TaxID=2994561 RepID=A0A9J6Z9E5_9BACL|nr:MAG: hypothetical protein NAG76_13350 [Candidatus Pristimantibacillus lignocellulolyticus]
MRLPPFERYFHLLQLVGVFIIGGLVGAILLNTLHTAQFEAFYNSRSELEEKLIQYEKDIHNLSQYKSQHTVIKRLQLRIEDENNSSEKPKIDTLTQNELIKQVREDLSMFIGQSIYDIDSNAQFARKILEKKVYSGVLNNSYTIEMKTVLLVDNTLQVWMTVRKYTPPPS